MPTTRRSFLVASLVVSSAAVATAAGLGVIDWSHRRAAAQGAVTPVFTGIVPGVAVGGYDPVAYFTDAKPVAGKPEISLEHEGATWRFASEANREAFRKEPAKFAPQYGGYCAWAIAQGYTAKGDPAHWSIVDNRLYLNFDRSIKDRWERDKAGFIKKGDASWPAIVGRR